MRMGRCSLSNSTCAECITLWEPNPAMALIGRRARHALVDQIREDGFIKRNKIVPRIFVDVNANFFCRTFGKHLSSLEGGTGTLACAEK